MEIYPKRIRSFASGIIIAMLLSSFNNTLSPLLKFRNEVDTTMETIEGIAEVAEHVAEEVEKIANLIAKELPEGELKKTVCHVESLAETTSKDAHLVEEVIHSIQETEGKVEGCLEPMAEEVMRNIMASISKKSTTIMGSLNWQTMNKTMQG